MSKTTIIPAGYRLTVTSWENDADNYQTHSLSGLTKGQVKFYVDFCALLASGDSDDNKFGNMYEPDGAEIDAFVVAVYLVAKAHIAAENIVFTTNESILDFLVANVDDLNEFGNCVSEAMGDFMGYSSDQFYTRVFESHVVEYFPESIEIADVTSEFPIA